MPTKRSLKAKKAVRTRKSKSTGKKAANTRKRRAAAWKAAATEKPRAAAPEVQVVPAEEPPAAAEAPDIITD